MLLQCAKKLSLLTYTSYYYDKISSIGCVIYIYIYSLTHYKLLKCTAS